MEKQDFGWAIEQLKAGKLVSRVGWNGKGMWLALLRAQGTHVFTLGTNSYEMRPWIGMKTADGNFVPWTASQTDILAEDWVHTYDTNIG